MPTLPGRCVRTNFSSSAVIQPSLSLLNTLKVSFNSFSVSESWIFLYSKLQNSGNSTKPEPSTSTWKYKEYFSNYWKFSFYRTKNPKLFKSWLYLINVIQKSQNLQYLSCPELLILLGFVQLFWGQHAVPETKYYFMWPYFTVNILPLLKWFHLSSYQKYQRLLWRMPTHPVSIFQPFV